MSLSLSKEPQSGRYLPENAEPLLRADLHVHTCYSPDSRASLEDILKVCQRKGINCLAITDHNTIAGAVKLKDIAPFPVIVGEEVMTSSGEVIGYFLEEEIPRGLPAEETIARIKAQGGLVCLPHPFDQLTRSPLRSRERQRLLSQIDIIEVFNSRSLFPGASAKARSFARQNGFLASAGSDAHLPREVGNAYVRMPPFSGPEDFLVSLSQGEIFGHLVSPLVHLATVLDKLLSRKKG